MSLRPTPLQTAQANLRWLEAKRRIVLAELATVERAALLAALPGARLHARAGQVSAAHPARPQSTQPHTYAGLDGRAARHEQPHPCERCVGPARHVTPAAIAQANAYLASLGVPESLL